MTNIEAIEQDFHHFLYMLDLAEWANPTLVWC